MSNLKAFKKDFDNNEYFEIKPNLEDLGLNVFNMDIHKRAVINDLMSSHETKFNKIKFNVSNYDKEEFDFLLRQELKISYDLPREVFLNPLVHAIINLHVSQFDFDTNLNGVKKIAGQIIKELLRENNKLMDRLLNKE